MNEPRIIQVKIGEVHLGRPGDLLKATLGSCIGIGIFWERRRVYGLAHCLLPVSPVPSFAISARYVTQAIPSLLTLMKISPKFYREIKIVVVGGGNMTSSGNKSEALIGDLNVRATLETLTTKGLTPEFQDVGGTEGRNIEINCEDGSYHVHKIPRIEAA